ncbi:hypothetical protein [Sphingobacterium faecale]|uniref:Uncharacterized protein n=1 Tax=Sphingobacterium faecale TaxID=2803775 RepID=A0ABS1R9F3_9SPHI|nr:hypothetical protein [Sphingobacterium faecale]MBL1411336.1 hypothetical protein [Sphingobacterium faecale]
MKKLLLTCATRSFSMRVAQQLSGKFELVLATSDEVPALFGNRYHKIPEGVSPTYAHEVLKTALDFGCDYVLPLDIDEIATLSSSLILFEEYGIRVLCPGIKNLKSLSVLDNPAKELKLSLFVGGYDVLSGRSESVDFNGLGMLSDSGDSFILAVSK